MSAAASNQPGPHPDPSALGAEAREEWRRLGSLPPVPPGLVETRGALHQIAEQVVSAARQRATGNEIALRWYPGGFGTPAFHDDRGDRVVRVQALELVDECDGSARRVPLSTLRRTGELVADLVDAHELAEASLDIDRAATELLGAWFCFGTLVIADLRVAARDELDPGWVQLWPEHFDVATELGSEAKGQRAAYGASPGDEHHAEPYLYVAPWRARPEGDLWNATGFSGAELRYAELLESADPVAAASDFLNRRLASLTGG